MNSTNQNQFIEFLFKCLDKHERKASILFTKLDLENGRVDLISRLLNDYSDVFDFEMVNPKFMMKTFTELLNDANKLKIESANKTSEIQKQLLGSFEDELKKIQQQISDNKIEYENMKNK